MGIGCGQMLGGGYCGFGTMLCAECEAEEIDDVCWECEGRGKIRNNTTTPEGKYKLGFLPCPTCSQKTSNKNQPKYASAIGGGNADLDADSLESRYVSKKVDTPKDDSSEASGATKEDNGHGTFPSGLKSNEERNPAHTCMGDDCGKYLGHRGFCSTKCHDSHYDDLDS